MAEYFNEASAHGCPLKPCSSSAREATKRKTPRSTRLQDAIRAVPPEFPARCAGHSTPLTRAIVGTYSRSVPRLRSDLRRFPRGKLTASAFLSGAGDHAYSSPSRPLMWDYIHPPQVCQARKSVFFAPFFPKQIAKLQLTIQMLSTIISQRLCAYAQRRTESGWIR